MRFHTSTAVTACGLAAGLAVAGCTPGSSSSPSSAAQTGNAVSTHGSSPSSSPQAQAAGSPSTCQPANLSFALGTRSGGAGQQTMAVDLTNKGSSACTMDGFPGVDLVGAANGKQNYTWSLTRSSSRYSKVTVQPGETAHFDLKYLPGVSGDGTNMTVVKMVVTPPNAYTHSEVTWSQPVLLQDGATHTGTYIMPVVSGS